ncbi:YugN-like family protein [Texcoconibacillus texcoconensis]|nr:YugN-like family protein [Texcoconibacillus texcoconensis]
MITLPSKVENQTFLLNDIEKQIKPLGYVIGGNWDYEHGYFDYKMEDNGSYLFVRVPFQAVEGELDQQGVEVKLGRPFLLSHKYQSGLDDWVDDESALVNQFSEPVDKDAPFPKEWIDTGRAHVHELEEVLLR